MDKRGVARNLRAISTLYSLMRDGEEQVAHYRSAADAIRKLPTHTKLDIEQLRTQFSFSESVLTSIHLLLTQGRKATMTALPISVPWSLLELMELPGFTPKLAGRLYRILGIRSLEELEKALTKGSLSFAHVLPDTQLPHLQQAIEKLRLRKSALSLPVSLRIAQRSIDQITKTIPQLSKIELTGSVRRMCPISTKVELLASFDGSSSIIVQLSQLGYAPAHKSTNKNEWPDFPMIQMTLEKMVEFDDHEVPIILYLVTPQTFALAWTLTTGDKAHAQRLNKQAKDRSLSPIAYTSIQTEEEVYRTLQHPYLLPELREEGCLDAVFAELVQAEQIKADLHMHSTYSDGADTMEAMIERCIEKGYICMAITDHSQSLDIAHGLSIDRLMRQQEEIYALREKYPTITIFHGTEVDILADATLDFPDVILEQLDFVVASIHTAMTQSKAELTARLLYAIESPHVDVIAHPTGRMIGLRDSYTIDFDRVFSAAEHSHIALELNCNPSRLDLDPQWLRVAMSSHCTFAIDSDAHSVHDLERLTIYGATVGRKGLLTPDRIINTFNVSQLSQWLGTGR